MVEEPLHDIVPLALPQRVLVDGATVGAVLVHGFSGSPYQMRDLGSFLNQQGVSTSILRLPGHGSRLEYFAQSKYDDWMGAVRKDVDAMTQRCRTIVLIGRSFGGVLALLEAQNRPERISGVVLIAVPYPRLMYRVQDALLPVARIFKKSIHKMWARPEENEERKRQGRYLELPLPSLHQFFLTMERVRSMRLRNFQIPVMIVQGMKDEQAKPRNIDWYESRLGDAVKDIVLVSNATHDAPSLHSDEEMQKRLVAFLRTSCTVAH